ncbi:MAG TPA: hypothetical protein VGM59_11065 [Dongiaceae bacterium]|jgi:hypothetical protein
MKRHGVYAGVAVVLLAGFAAGADAQQQGRYYPDGTNCSLLSDDEIVQCQNQIYQRQLESGQSAEATGPSDQTVVPSGTDSGAGGLPGASTTNYGTGGSAGGAETFSFPNPKDVPPNNGVVTPDDGSSSD